MKTKSLKACGKIFEERFSAKTTYRLTLDGANCHLSTDFRRKK